MNLTYPKRIAGMTNMIDEIIEEAAKRYGKMPLKELLAEENLTARLLHAGRHDTAVRRLHKILRSELERRLR
jgi:hypothetical protein